MKGLLLKSIGGFYLVKVTDKIYECKARGALRNKEILPCVGDYVEIEELDDSKGIINSIYPRRNNFLRPPLSNLDNLILVVSTCQPRPNSQIIDEIIAVCEYKGITPILVFTKTDLESNKEFISIYQSTGYKVLTVNNLEFGHNKDFDDILANKISGVIGNTGVGKSTLINNINKNIVLQTSEISKKLGRGKHTTRHVELYELENGGYIADTPGFSTMDFLKYDEILKNDLEDCFIEFRKFKNQCKFTGCSHTVEKGCKILEAVENNQISLSRHKSYVAMYEKSKKIKEWNRKK